MEWVADRSDLANIADGVDADTVMAAINLSGNQPRRQMLREWAESLWVRIWDGMPGTLLGHPQMAF